MADESPLDAAPPDDLARAFVLPEWVDQHDMRALHTAIVERLRREASGMPMNTVQQLLLERIAYIYIVLKWKEETNGFSSPGQQKDFNAWWLSMTQEFNRLLTANQDRMREALLMQVQQIVNDSLRLISDEEDRRTVRRALAEAFAAVDL